MSIKIDFFFEYNCWPEIRFSFPNFFFFAEKYVFAKERNIQSKTKFWSTSPKIESCDKYCFFEDKYFGKKNNFFVTFFVKIKNSINNRNYFLKSKFSLQRAF